MFSLENILACVFLVLIFRVLSLLHTKYGGKHRLTTEDYLAKMARIKNCSVYDLFHRAALDWCIARKKVESDFTSYLLQQRIPFYVNDLVRRHKEELDMSHDLPLLMGHMYY